jgi:hypothetical protein
VLNEKHDYQSASYIHSDMFYSNFKQTLTQSLSRNYTTVQDLNNLFHFVFTKYFNNPQAFIDLVNVPNVHSRFAQYMGFHQGLSFIGKSGTLGFGMVSNEAAAIYDLINKKILGYFSILTKDNRKRIYQSFDILALTAIEIGKLYEKIEILSTKI